jgi:hypothetical protein
MISSCITTCAHGEDYDLKYKRQDSCHLPVHQPTPRVDEIEAHQPTELVDGVIISSTNPLDLTNQPKVDCCGA